MTVRLRNVTSVYRLVELMELRFCSDFVRLSLTFWTSETFNGNLRFWLLSLLFYSCCLYDACERNSIDHLAEYLNSRIELDIESMMSLTMYPYRSHYIQLSYTSIVHSPQRLEESAKVYWGPKQVLENLWKSTKLQFQIFTPLPARAVCTARDWQSARMRISLTYLSNLFWRTNPN